MEFEIFISHNLHPYTLKVYLFYNSNQLMRYKVFGKKGFIVLQNNFPFLQSTKKQRSKISWKLIEGEIKETRLLNDIIIQLERELSHMKY